jgi:hypothetical protein
MGCDGGSIPRRAEMVKTVEAKEKPDANSQLVAKYTLCSISKTPLQAPIVACYYGKLYNKDAILELLIDRDSFGDADILCPHIKSLKDIVTLNLELNPQGTKPVKSIVANDFQDNQTVFPFICPITKKEMNGHSKFIFLQSCGCVVSELALKTIKTNECLVCNLRFEPEDVIIINPITEKDIKVANDRIDMRLSKKKKRKVQKLDPKKRKTNQEPALLGSSDEEKKLKKSKRQKGINMVMPDMSTVHGATSSLSDAVSKLYKRDGEKVKETWMTKGTFNRYV